MARLVERRRGRSASIERGIDKKQGELSDTIYDLIAKLPSDGRAEVLQELAKLYTAQCGHRRENCECEETEESTGYHYDDE